MELRDPGDTDGRWRGGYAPYRQALKDLKLPPRGPRGSAVNRKRARLVQQTLHKLKLRRRPLSRGADQPGRR